MKPCKVPINRNLPTRLLNVGSWKFFDTFSNDLKCLETGDDRKTYFSNKKH